jgi:hypothetical protein
VFGQHESGWLSFYDYFFAIGLQEPVKRLEGLLYSARECGWFLPLRGICFVSAKPSVLCRDDDGRLHCEYGPALSYIDGLSIFAIHGVRVPESVILAPEKQTIAEIEGENNAEIKRVRIERFGWQRYLTESGAAVVNTRLNDRDAQLETLYRTKDGTRRIVVADPSTGRRYALGVPREVTTCEQAQAWMSHGLDRFAIHRS